MSATSWLAVYVISSPPPWCLNNFVHLLFLDFFKFTLRYFSRRIEPILYIILVKRSRVVLCDAISPLIFFEKIVTDQSRDSNHIFMLVERYVVDKAVCQFIPTFSKYFFFAFPKWREMKANCNRLAIRLVCWPLLSYWLLPPLYRHNRCLLQIGGLSEYP